MLLTCRHDVARRGSADGAVVVAAVLSSGTIVDFRAWRRSRYTDSLKMHLGYASQRKIVQSG